MDNEISPLSQQEPPMPSHFSLKHFLRKKTVLIGLGFFLSICMGTYILVSPSTKHITAPFMEQIVAPVLATPTPLPSTPTPTNEPTITPSPAPSKTPTPLPTIDPAIPWKTYKNAAYSYTINYPSDWIARDLGILEPKIPSYIVFNPKTASTSSRFLTVSVSTRTYQEQLTFGASSSATLVAGIAGTKQFFKDSDGNTSTVVILPRANNTLLAIRAKTAYLPIFNFMLSSLKFTN